VSAVAWPRDHADAAALLAGRVPGVRDGDTLVPFGEGDYTLAFLAGDQVVRVARHARAAAALGREACVLAGLADALPLAVPRPVLHATPDAAPFTVHALVPGDVLTRERWEALPPAAFARAAGDLARLLAALHAAPVAPGETCGVPVLDGAALVADVRARAGARLHALLEPPMRDRLDEALGSWAAGARGAPAPVLLHADVAPGHVLFDARDGALTGVIDFGDLALGDPARDFVYVYGDFGPAILDAVLRRYAPEAPHALAARVRRWYLLETALWAAAAVDAGDAAEMREAAAELTRELAEPIA
jgi:aminoglycoside 2''-phosphotransferase